MRAHGGADQWRRDGSGDVPTRGWDDGAGQRKAAPREAVGRRGELTQGNLNGCSLPRSGAGWKRAWCEAWHSARRTHAQRRACRSRCDGAAWDAEASGGVLDGALAAVAAFPRDGHILQIGDGQGSQRATPESLSPTTPVAGAICVFCGRLFPHFGFRF
jgi:hypothetical protein